MGRTARVFLNTTIDAETGERLPVALLPAQAEVIRSRAFLKVILGGWGSGKTRSAVLELLLVALANPRTPAYGQSSPFSLVIGLTRDVLRDSAHNELMSLCPPELLIKETKQPWEVTLCNGHVLKFRTMKGNVEGGSVCAVLLDEAHRLPSIDPFLNYQARVRDPKARRHCMIVSGLPEDGWMREAFDGKAADPDRLLVFARTEDNIHLPPHVVAQLRASASEKTAIKYLEGQWMKPEKVVWFEYSPARHLVDVRGDRAATTHIGLDVGDQAAVVFAQERPAELDAAGAWRAGRSVHIVDQWLPDQVSAREIAIGIRDRGWRLDRDSRIFVDPKTRRDELASLREILPLPSIVRRKRGDPAEQVEWGHGCVNVALRNAEGITRLTVDRELERHRRGLINSIPRLSRGPNGRPRKDDTHDHVLDAMRYAVAGLAPLARGQHLEIQT